MSAAISRSVQPARSVLITDGEQRAALAIVRSLGAAGYRCIVCASASRNISGSSRYAAAQIMVADCVNSAASFAADVQRIVRDERIDLIIPVSEAAVLALLPVRDSIDAVIPFPPLPVFEAICDKSRVLAQAAVAGIKVPEQRELASVNDAADPGIPLPAVLKPARSVFTDEHGVRGKVTVRWARTQEEVREGLEAYPAGAFLVLAQRAVEGPGVGIFVLLHKGRLLARFAHRRVREKPPSGGVSVLRQSEPMDARLLERSLDLLRSFDWDGVAMIEYKLDERTGDAYLMEINGRFWGSLQLAIDAGVDFPVLLAAASFDEPMTPVESYRFVRSRWFWGDVDHLIARWREPGSTWRLRAGSAVRWLRGFGPAYSSEIFRWSDPLPFARETLEWFRSLHRR